MKKVFLSLAVVAVLTVVSCKKAEAPAEEVAVDTTAVVVDTTAVVVDSTSTTTDTVAAPATEEAAK
ncbi:hypothetical protein [Flavobacterium seoulense]|uniref:Lipoprotein n=1 Tax=Flavobacterium seoulense TaxID=1492738 RepID=A0A066WKA7_9FLAO|nr:hypothetical protein [Flavobacterium seoulense]KDN54427.1 hypothetical protein FEM21_23890 [Flavobacterium seoulense]